MNEEKKDERLALLNVVAEQIGNKYNPEQIGVIQKQVAKGTNLNDLAYFLNVCITNGMNPFNKEIWCYKDHKQNLVIFTGRDGYMKKAQEHPKFAGMRSSEVRQNDDFHADIPNGIIEHRFSLEERGPIVGAYAIVFRIEGEPTVEVVKFSEYNKSQSVWKTHPHEMIKKVAESKALKKAFGLLPGVQLEDDFIVSRDRVVPMRTETHDMKLEKLQSLFLEYEDMLSAEEIQMIERIVKEREASSYEKAIKTIKQKI